MVKVQDGLIFAGALSLWMADRVVEQTMTSRGRVRLAVGTGCAVLALTGLLYVTTGHLWASNLSQGQAGKTSHTLSMDTPAMLGLIDDAKSEIRQQRLKLQRVRQHEALAMLASTSQDPISTGRSDPFEPLIKAPVIPLGTGIPQPALFKPKPADPFNSVSFAGAIGDAGSASVVGIFKLNDPQRGMVTQIKRIGENLQLSNGQSAQLKAVGRGSAELLFNGQLRTVSLLSYDDTEGGSSMAPAKTAPVMTAQPLPTQKPIINLGGLKE